MDTPAPFFVHPAGWRPKENPWAHTGRPLRYVRVLLIEDNPGDARLIQEFLKEAEESEFKLTSADRLKSGLERLRQGPFDVVLLDLSLPESRGLDTLRTVLAHAGDAPIVVLTGIDDEKLAFMALQTGAQDYLVKGHVDSNSLVRSVHYAIERARRRKAEAALHVSEEEFRIAREIQQKLYPPTPQTFAGFELAGASDPALAAGGDYFDYFPMSDESIAVTIGDVSGHGVGPALLMSRTGAYLRALALTSSDVRAILNLANHLLVADVPEGHYVTLFFARIDPRNRTLVYSSAGHPTGYILAPSGDVKQELKSTNMPLGLVLEYNAFSSPEIVLEPGELVLLLTDGVLQACDMSADRVLDIVHVNRTKPAGEIVRVLHRFLQQFSTTQPHHDDITSMVIKVGEPGSN